MQLESAPFSFAFCIVGAALVPKGPAVLKTLRDNKSTISKSAIAQ